MTGELLILFKTPTIHAAQPPTPSLYSFTTLLLKSSLKATGVTALLASQKIAPVPSLSKTNQASERFVYSRQFPRYVVLSF
jgi:hypothetical protein